MKITLKLNKTSFLFIGHVNLTSKEGFKEIELSDSVKDDNIKTIILNSIFLGLVVLQDGNDLERIVNSIVTKEIQEPFLSRIPKKKIVKQKILKK